ncbi:MAG: hypothetical protein DRJ09_02740 [Bacteroidetes bacterium]|nr:MAG: hypothetical protein DRJ09_02740 [Bacteroidota bacterium]
MLKKLLFSVIVIGLLVVSCKQSGKFEGFTKGPNNVWYKAYTHSDDTSRVRFNNFVTAKMRYYLKDSVLFDSKELDNKFVFPVIKPMFQGDIYNGIKLMSPGDSFTFAVVADSFFYKTANLKKLPDYVTPGELMYFDIKLLKIQTQGQYKKSENQKLQREKVKQFKLLADYVKENNITTKPLESGLIYTTLQKGYGRQPRKGDMCQVFMKVKAIGVDYNLYNNFDKDPLFIEYGKAFDTPGLMQGLGLMHEGEKARLIVPSNIGIGQDGKGGAVPPFSTIIYEIKLDKLKTKEEVKKMRKAQAQKNEKEKEALKNAEPAKIAAYIKQHNITVEPTASGLYFISEKEGIGAHPEIGNTLSVHYTLYNLKDEKLFSTLDNGRPFKFVLGSGTVIPAWEEALPMMRKSGKAKLIIPSSLAYKGVEKRAFNIPPYSPLIIELTLQDITK